MIGEPVRQAGQLIEITMDSAPMRAEMIDFGLRLLAVSAAFSILTALLLNLAAQRLIVQPIRRVIGHMIAYANAPDDARRTRVALTDEGQRLARGFRGQRREQLQTALADFTPAERADLARLLTKLAASWPQG
mgnify:CR=1 FL=1